MAEAGGWWTETEGRPEKGNGAVYIQRKRWLRALSCDYGARSGGGVVLVPLSQMRLCTSAQPSWRSIEMGQSFGLSLKFGID